MTNLLLSVVRHALRNMSNSGETFTSPVNSYWANPYGLYNMCGNAAEMTATAGSTKGGSWETSGKYVWIQSKFDAYEGVTGPSPGIGFRPVFTYLGK